MNSGAVVLVGAVMLFTAAVVVRADDYTGEAKAAPRVAEMLQKRQENLLREQLLKEGRLDEVRKIDEERVRRQHERQQKVVSQMNDDLARSTRSDASTNGAVLDACDKETLR